MNVDANALPYTTRVEFSPGRGRNVLTFQDKTIPLTVSYPLPEAYGSADGSIPAGGSYMFCEGIAEVLRLVYLETRASVLREFAQQQAAFAGQKNSPIAGALIDVDPEGPQPEAG